MGLSFNILFLYAEKEPMIIRSSIVAWGFSVARCWVPKQTAFSQAMDAEKAFNVTSYKELNKVTNIIIQKIADKVINTVIED